MENKTELGLLEAARKFGISPQLIRYWIKKGWVIQLEAPIGPGKSLKLDEQSLIDALTRYKPRRNPNFIISDSIAGHTGDSLPRQQLSFRDRLEKGYRKLNSIGVKTGKLGFLRRTRKETRNSQFPSKPESLLRRVTEGGMRTLVKRSFNDGRATVAKTGKAAWAGVLSSGTSLPGRLIVALVITGLLTVVLLNSSTVQAVTLSSTCNPSSQIQGQSVICTLNVSFDAGANERVSIDKLRMKVGSEKIDFNLEGTPIGTGNSASLAITAIPQRNSGTGYGYGYSSGTLSGYGFGYSSSTGYGFHTIGPGSVGYGYGYGVGYQFLQTLTYQVTINTTPLPEASYDVDFVLLTLDAKVTKFSATGSNRATFTVIAQEEAIAQEEVINCGSNGSAVGGVCNCHEGYAGATCALQLETTGTVDQILASLTDKLPSQAASVIDNILDPAKRATVLAQIPNVQVAAVVKNMNEEKLAAVFKSLDDGAANIINEIAKDPEATAKAANALAVLAKTDPEKAANAISKANSKSAAAIVDKTEPKAAGKILSNLGGTGLNNVVKEMTPTSALKRLQHTTPVAMNKVANKVLFEKLKEVPADVIANYKTAPAVPAAFKAKVTQTFGKVSVYTTTKCVRLESVHFDFNGNESKTISQVCSAAATPAPLERVLIQPDGEVGEFSTIVNIAGEKKPTTAPALPDGLVAKEYFYVTPSLAPEKIKSGLIGFFVEQSWLEENGYHKWSVQLQRLNSDTGEWQAVQPQRTSEDDTFVYYDATVPGFSLFAITGGAEPATIDFTVTDLQVSPEVAVEGSSVTITASVTNSGATDETFPINLSIAGTFADAESVSVAAGATETVTFTVDTALYLAGTYEARVDREFATFTVEAQQVATPTPEPTTPPAPTATTAPAPTATSAPSPPSATATSAPSAPAPVATATSVPAPVSTATSVPAPAATSAPAPAPTAVATIEPAQDDDGGNLGLIIGIIIVVVLIGGGVAFFAVRSKRTV